MTTQQLKFKIKSWWLIKKHMRKLKRDIYKEFDKAPKLKGLEAIVGEENQ